MAEKLYHQQPCFCIPCRVIRNQPKSKQPASDTIADDETPNKKPKGKRGKKA
jgi:hypothetical protein